MIIHHCTGRQRECRLENVTLCFCNNFYIIQYHCTCKMCSNYPGISTSRKHKTTKLNFSLHWQKKMFVFKKTFFPQGISWCRGTKMATWTSCEKQGYKCQSTEFRQLDSGYTLFDSESLRNVEKLRFPHLDKNYYWNLHKTVLPGISDSMTLYDIQARKHTLLTSEFLFLLLNPCVPSESQSRISDAWGFCSQTFPTPWLFSLLISVLLVVG